MCWKSVFLIFRNCTCACVLYDPTGFVAAPGNQAHLYGLSKPCECHSEWEKLLRASISWIRFCSHIGY